MPDLKFYIGQRVTNADPGDPIGVRRILLGIDSSKSNMYLVTGPGTPWVLESQLRLATAHETLCEENAR